MKTNFIIVMGVSGSGKTEVGRSLAQNLGWDFYDADDFHPLQAQGEAAKHFQAPVRAEVEAQTGAGTFASPGAGGVITPPAAGGRPDPDPRQLRGSRQKGWPRAACL